MILIKKRHKLKIDSIHVGEYYGVDDGPFIIYTNKEFKDKYGYEYEVKLEKYERIFVSHELLHKDMVRCAVAFLLTIFFIFLMYLIFGKILIMKPNY